MFIILRSVAPRAAAVCYALSVFTLTLTTGSLAIADELNPIALVQPSVPEAPKAPTIWLNIAADENVAFSGQINYDKAGISNNHMMYPAPSFVGLLAAIATHGVIADTMKNNQKDKLRDQANKVLLEYESLLSDFKYSELVAASFDMMTKTGKKRINSTTGQIVSNDIIIESHPQFILTQDQRAIILDNSVSIQTVGNTTPYRMQVRVVSNDIGEDAPAKTWTANQGHKLKSESERLFAVSLDMALDNLGTENQEEGQYKTFRFQEGGLEKIERGQFVREDCNSIIFRSLRGDLVSVPPKNDNCAETK